MTITLTDDLEKLVNEKVQSGAYQSAEEVVAASLRLLKAREESVEVLRRGIMRGVVDIREGQFSTYATDDELQEFSEQIIRQGRKS